MLEPTKIPQKNSTRVSPASPASSPLTPELGTQPHQEPVLAGYPHQSATLDAIGAWSSVQPADPSTVYPASATQHHNPAEGNIHGGVPLPPTDLHGLGSKYNAMSLSGGGSSSHIDIRHGNSTGGNGPISANSSSAINETDYSELDEAILRGRSTTLPNIMAIPNSLYRYSGTLATDGNAVSANENAGFGGILSSRSNDNNDSSDRAGSPLPLSLKTNPIHQSASLGNQLTSSLDPFQFSSSISPSARNGNAPPLSASSRRFSEFGVGSNSNELSSSTSYLSIASYSMVAAAAPPPPANRTKATVNGNSGVSHANSGRAAFAPNAIGSHATSFLHPGHHQPPAATLETAAAPSKYASSSSFSQQQQMLPTMREDDNGSSSSSLTRHMSLSRYSNTTAIPQPLSSSSSNLYGFHSQTAASATSPIHESNPAASSSSYIPTRVHSLKDMGIRHPSPGPNTNSNNTNESLLHITKAEEQMVNSLFEQAAQTQSFDPQLPPPGGMVGMHRRHSLASTSLSTAAGSLGGVLGKHQATNANAWPKPKTPGPGPANSSSNSNTAIEEVQKGTVPQGHGDEHQFSIHPVPLQRQYSTPTMLPFGGQLALYPSRPPAAGAIGSFIPGDGSSGSQQQHYAYATTAYPGMYGGAGVGQQYAAHNLAFVPGMQPPPMMTPHPPHLQPPPGNMQGQPPPGLVHSPMPFAMQVQAPVQPPPPPPPPVSTHQQKQQQQQQQQQQKEKQQHARRASHPTLPASSVSMRPQNLAAVVSSNSSSVGIASSIGGGTHPPILPNPATTITPNMPFADMGKGLAYKSLSQGTRVFVVQFKGRRSDLFFAPKKGMESRIIPTMAPSSSAMSAPKATKDKKSTKAAVYEPGTFVLVEGDRGVDLGEIKEELTAAESIQAFSNSQSFDASNGSDHHDSSRHNSTAGSSSMHASGDESSSAGREVFVKRIFRPAYQSEITDLTKNKASDEQKALSMCQGKVQQRKLCMRVVDAEFQFDRRKLTFYFTADRRVDFRELVRELFKHFKTRIWMCQQTTTSH